MNSRITALCLMLLIAPVAPVVGPVFSGDLTFDSFEAAEAAAKKRADDYQKKMQEHIKNVNDQWEKQQKDLGSDASTPDIGKITTREDGQKSSDNDASKSLEDAVSSSVNKLKDDMVNSASPNSTGFAGGAAGYQWSVKFKGGKYVLSDSYNEAEFNTGKKKEDAPPPPKKAPEETGEDSGSDEDATTTVASTKPSTTPAPSTSANPEPTPTVTGTSPAPEKPASPEDPKPVVTAKPGTTTAPAEEAAKPLTGVDPAPVKLPPPSVRLVIQHPTDFSEEIFASNATSETTTNYKLDKFKIPEDTRIKIAVEVGQDVNPEDVSLVVTDDEGESSPVSSTRLKNYRHMFRVPSDDKYSASVFVADKKTPGNQQKKILQVMIPVTKMDFESRTIDNQRGTKGANAGGAGSNNMSTSDTSSSAGSEDVNHSSFGQPQQVDLSDLYSSPDAAGNVAAGAGNSSGSEAGSNSSAGAAGSSSGSSAGGADEGSATGGSVSSSGSADSADSSAAGAVENSGADPADSTGATDENGRTSDSNVSDDNTSGSETAAGGGSSDDTSASNPGSESSGDSSGQAAADSDQNGASSGSSSSEVDAAVNVDAAQNQAGTQYAAATGVNSDEPDKVGAAVSAAAGKNAADGEPAASEEDAFLVALSLRSEAQKFYQSYDFIDGSTQTTSALKAGGEVVFGLSMSAQVDPESIMIKLYDGSQEIKGNLKRMGESFAYVFATPTADAYIELTGKAGKRSFTYRVSIPVSGK